MRKIISTNRTSYSRQTNGDRSKQRAQYKLLLQILELCCDAEEEFFERNDLFAPFEAIKSAVGERFLELCELFENECLDLNLRIV
jgi:hypothetical protein